MSYAGCAELERDWTIAAGGDRYRDTRYAAPLIRNARE